MTPPNEDLDPRLERSKAELKRQISKEAEIREREKSSLHDFTQKTVEKTLKAGKLTSQFIIGTDPLTDRAIRSLDKGLWEE